MAKDLVMIAGASIALTIACLGFGLGLDRTAAARPVHPHLLDARLNSHRCCRIVAFNHPLVLEA